MKVETKATERVTKEEKILTISESEFKEILSESAKAMLAEDLKLLDEPSLRLILTISYAGLCTTIHKNLFNLDEEDN